MIESLNMFDLIVFGVIGLSAMLSFFRGFLREVLSLGAWVGASVITLYAFPDMAKIMEPHIKSEGIANGFAAMATFMVSLLVISILTSVIMRYSKNSAEVGLLDNGLGLIFGALRGALLISLGYFIMSMTTHEDNYPEWVKSAATRQYAEKGAGWIGSVAPDYFKSITPPKDRTPELDKAIHRGEEAVDESWQSMDELQRRMREEKEE